MTRSRILNAFPGAIVKKLLWDKPEVVLFDEAGWWVIDATSRTRRCIDTFSFGIVWNSQCNAADLLDTLRSWNPMWSRWVAHADQYELLYREALIYVMHVREALSSLQITHVVFHAGISHHIDSSLLEIACADVGIPQTFLYANNVIGGRLQPLRQLRSIEDRKPSGVEFSTYQAADDIRAFRSNALAGRPPRIGFSEGWTHRSFLFGVLDAYYLEARRSASRIKRLVSRTRTRNSSFLQQFEPLGAREFVRLMANQRRAIKYLRSRVCPNSLREILERTTARVLLLAAHFQPEATSFPEGGDLHNHLDIVVRLRTLGFEGPILYKEHIGSAHYFTPIVHQTQVGMCRSVSYYQRLEELGCVFVEPHQFVPVDPALNERFVPVSITGSIAVERSLAGLTTIVSGYPWYRELPGTTSLRSSVSLKNVEVTSPGGGEKLSQESLAFLDAMLSRQTILNAPGIGTGKPLTDRDSEKTFRQEFSQFHEQL